MPHSSPLVVFPKDTTRQTKRPAGRRKFLAAGQAPEGDYHASSLALATATAYATEVDRRAGGGACSTTSATALDSLVENVEHFAMSETYQASALFSWIEVPMSEKS